MMMFIVNNLFVLLKYQSLLFTFHYQSGFKCLEWKIDLLYNPYVLIISFLVLEKHECIPYMFASFPDEIVQKNQIVCIVFKINLVYFSQLIFFFRQA